MAREQRRELRLTTRLQLVVALLEEASLRLFEDLRDIDTRCERASHQLADRSRLEVGADRSVDAGMLHLHRDRRSIVHHPTMDLTDRRGRDGRALEPGEQRIAAGPEVIPDDLLDLF